MRVCRSNEALRQNNITKGTQIIAKGEAAAENTKIKKRALIENLNKKRTTYRLLIRSKV
jgi:hypothetical protein